MSLAIMKHCNQPSTEQTFHPLSPSLAIRLNGLIQTMTTEAQKIGACYGLTKYPCNRRHQIQLRRSSCNTHIEHGVSFLHIYREIQLWLKSLGAVVYRVLKISTPERGMCGRASGHGYAYIFCQKTFFIQGERVRAILTIVTNDLNKAHKWKVNKSKVSKGKNAITC